MLKVVFEGDVFGIDDGNLAIDDIFINTKSACRPKASCTFEDSLCSWTQSPTNDFSLLRITAQLLDTIQPNNRIYSDTTTNSKYGHFLWISPEYYTNINPGRSTSILSELIPHNDYREGACFSFSYFISGENPGKIRIYKIIQQSPKQEIFTISSSKGNKWNQERINVNNPFFDYEILVEVEIGTSGNIAIDDLYLYPDDCSVISTTPSPDSEFNCGDGQTVSYGQVCDFIQDCANGMDEILCANCKFDETNCQFIDVSTGAIIWSRTQAKSSRNGPFIDASSSSSGYYMQVDSVSRSSEPSSLAVLRLDQQLKPCSSTCKINFFYHMYGVSDDLKVYLVEDSYKTLLVELKGNYGDQWYLQTLVLGRISRAFALEFHATKYSTESEHDLAIDDISLINCEYPYPRSSCRAGEFTCERKSCIPMYQVCDLVDDCGDNSDEANCDKYAQCDFETGFCDWLHDEGDFRWQIKRGRTSQSSIVAPLRDHTVKLTFKVFYLKLKSSIFL